MRGSNASARCVRSSRSIRSAISSETFAAQPAANALISEPAQPAPSAPPAALVPRVSTARERQPELAIAQVSWLELFALHAPIRNGSLSREKSQMLADARFSQNSEFAAFVNLYFGYGRCGGSRYSWTRCGGSRIGKSRASSSELLWGEPHKNI